MRTGESETALVEATCQARTLASPVGCVGDGRETGCTLNIPGSTLYMPGYTLYMPDSVEATFPK